MTAPATIQLLGKTAVRRDCFSGSSYAAARWPFVALVDGSDANKWRATLREGSHTDRLDGMFGSLPEAAAACDGEARALVAEMEWFRNG